LPREGARVLAVATARRPAWRTASQCRPGLARLPHPTRRRGPRRRRHARGHARRRRARVVARLVRSGRAARRGRTSGIPARRAAHVPRTGRALWRSSPHQEGVDLPHRARLLPEEGVMTDTYEVEIDLPHDRDRVWRALTDPKEMQTWFCEHAEVDLDAGRYDFWGRFTPGVPGREDGYRKIVDLEPGRLLRFAWPWRGGDSIVTITLDGDTRLN